jgi:hypothetical protein
LGSADTTDGGFGGALGPPFLYGDASSLIGL